MPLCFRKYIITIYQDDSVIGYINNTDQNKCSFFKFISLGHDARAWAMYIDQKRSWFLHNGEHFDRTDGGIGVGSVIGVRLDCERGSLAYYLDDEPHGPIAFSDLPSGVYYPAISLNRDVQVTLRSGLEPPSSDSEDSDENMPAPLPIRPQSGKSNQPGPSV